MTNKPKTTEPSLRAPPAATEPVGLEEHPHELETRAEIAQFDAIMDFVEATLAGWRLERVWVDRICLIVDEAVMNIIHHAYPEAPGYLRLSLSFSNQIVRIELRDNGIYFDPTTYPDPDTSLPLEEREIGGLGIHFMRRMLDSFEYRREGDHNRLVVQVKAQRRPPDHDPHPLENESLKP